MTIKRKTQLNLSGSHRNLDADFAHIGSTLFVTGSVVVTGSMSSSGDLSSQGILRVQGATQLTGAVNLGSTLSASGMISTENNLFAQGTTQLGGAVNLYSTLSASGMISTANNLQVGQNAFVTGSLQVTGSIFVAAAGLISASVVSASVGVSASVLQGTTVTAEGLVSGSTGRFTYLSGALSASSTGLPFLVAGSNVTTTFSHTDLNWTIAATGGGGGGTVQGSDTFVQFNRNGAFAGSASFTHTSGTLGVHAISGSLTSSGTVFGDIGHNGNILKITSHVLVTQSAMLFDGVESALDFGGLALFNGAKLSVFSGSLDDEPPFGISLSNTPDQVQLRNVGTADFISGAVNLTFGSTLNVHSASQSGTGFAVIPDTTAGTVRLDINGRLFSNGTNISALTGSLRTGGAYGEPDSNIMSGSLLTAGMVNGSVGKFRVEVIGAAINGDQFISADLIVAASQSAAGVYGTFGVTEVTLDAIGTNALGWDVNINTNGDIAVTSSTVGVDWYAQVSKKMILSGSGIVIY